ncbi:MAG: molecular chaperone HtpG [Spirochaetota bacterium]|jgi:molecular chaperone HtpG|nr:molecular chaperone HtpG [Spirochaetota bacterium]
MADTKTIQFRTETQKLLHLVIHSLYSNPEIFLRELLSNASDALDKLRFLSLSEKELAREGREPAVTIAADAKEKTLTISDNGIGMNDEEMTENLGTIARSGTTAFVEALTDRKNAPELIGQFGVGFYSAFMVAHKVRVVSRKAGTDAAFCWESEGEGSFTITQGERSEWGTDVILFLKDDSAEYLEEYHIRSLVKKYSDFLEYPVRMDVEKKVPTEGEKDKYENKVVTETLNSQKAIWTRKPADISDEEYTEFYKHLSHDYDTAFERIHYSAEGTTEFNALLYLPARMPFDLLMQGDRMRGVHLYVRRVFIMDDAEALMPRYLRFVKGVVDSGDLPLNVSREILQQDRILAKIKSNLVKKILDALKNRLEKDRAAYSSFYTSLGSILKEGISLDYENREKIMDLLLFESTTTKPGETITLAEYLKAMPEGQKAIYVLAGNSRKELENSPYLEAVAAQNYPVLFFTDPVDEWLLPSMPMYQEKPFRALDKGEFPAAKDEKTDSQKEEYKDLLAYLGERFADSVKEVRVSARLVKSISCLVADEYDMGAHMEQLMKAMRQEVPKNKRILEINALHPLVEKLRALFAANEKKELADELADALLMHAVIAEGGRLENAADFGELFSKLLLEHCTLSV